MGARLGARLGSKLGGLAQTGLRRLFGMGEYQEAFAHEVGVEPEEVSTNDTPEVNTLVQPATSQDLPLVGGIVGDKEGAISVTRREFIRFVNIQELETFAFIQINPGYNGSFPWLHSVARSWQQYRICGMAFEYVPTSGFAVSSTSAALGQVALIPKYNVVEGVNDFPFTMADALNWNGAMSCSPAAPGTCYMECKPDQTNQGCKYVWTGELTVNDFSQQNYDAFNLLIITGGAQNTTVVQAGQLWVTYHIELYQPRTRSVLNPVGLHRPDVMELWDEYCALISFRGLMDQESFIRIQCRKAEILAALRTLSAVQELLQYDLARQLAEMKIEEEVPVVPPAIQRLIASYTSRCEQQALKRAEQKALESEPGAPGGAEVILRSTTPSYQSVYPN